MAVPNQTFTIFDRDKLTLRFIVSDNETSLTSGKAWWGVSKNLDGGPSNTGTLRFEKTTGAWNASSPAQDDTPGNETPNIILGTNTITCYLTQSDYGSTIDDAESNYHELVYSDDGTGVQSYVVSSGYLTIRPSIFTLKGYR